MFVKVKVFPKSKKELVKKIKEDKYEIFVIERRQNNEANKRLLQIVKELYPESRGLKIVKGQTTPNKIIEVLEPTPRLL